MERFDVDRLQHVSQARSHASPADPICTSAPTQADTASEVLPPQGRTSAAEGSSRDASVSSEDTASHSALPSEGSAPVPALPLKSSMDAWGIAYGRGGGFMAGGVEGLQAVLQDSSTALQQELRTAESKMEVCDSTTCSNEMPSLAVLCCAVLCCAVLCCIGVVVSCCTNACIPGMMHRYVSVMACCPHGPECWCVQVARLPCWAAAFASHAL